MKYVFQVYISRAKEGKSEMFSKVQSNIEYVCCASKWSFTKIFNGLLMGSKKGTAPWITCLTQ
jgi:hypothetical protein